MQGTYDEVLPGDASASGPAAIDQQASGHIQQQWTHHDVLSDGLVGLQALLHASHKDVHRLVLHKARGNGLDLPGPGGTEEQRLAVRGHHGHNSGDLRQYRQEASAHDMQERSSSVLIWAEQESILIPRDFL